MNTVVKTVSTKKEHRDFVYFPYRLYKKILKIPNWPAPLLVDEKTHLDRKKYPFYEHAEMQEFLAYRDGTPCRPDSGDHRCAIRTNTRKRRSPTSASSNASTIGNAHSRFSTPRFPGPEPRE